MRVVLAALEIAEQAHDGQKRRGGAAYITHPLAVANKFTDKFKVEDYQRIAEFLGRSLVGDELSELGDLDAQAVALLHDVIEDTDWTAIDLIKGGIPQHIVDAVLILTREEGQPYFEFIEMIKSQGPLVIQVKIQDILHNITGDISPSMIRRYAKALTILTK